MRILLIADEESKYLWDYYQPGRLKDIDLILSCGDLKQEYLEFLVTMGSKPLYYVHGNHDKGYVSFPPEGCECLDDRVINFQGLRILGLGAPFMITSGALGRSSIPRRKCSSASSACASPCGAARGSTS